MSKIDIDEARKLAKLSRLDFSEDELKNFTKEFEKMLSMFSELDGIDVSDISLIESALRSDGELRKDEIVESFSQDVILQNAPEKKDGAFIVPITVE